jgi:hypothetical protein
VPRAPRALPPGQRVARHLAGSGNEQERRRLVPGTQCIPRTPPGTQDKASAAYEAAAETAVAAKVRAGGMHVVVAGRGGRLGLAGTSWPPARACWPAIFAAAGAPNPPPCPRDPSQQDKAAAAAGAVADSAKETAAAAKVRAGSSRQGLGWRRR